MNLSFTCFIYLYISCFHVGCLKGTPCAEIETNQLSGFAAARLTGGLNATEADACCIHLFGTNLASIDDSNNEQIQDIKNLRATINLVVENQHCWYGLYCDNSNEKWAFRDGSPINQSCTASIGKCGTHENTEAEDPARISKSVNCVSTSISCVICGVLPPTFSPSTAPSTSPSTSPSTAPSTTPSTTPSMAPINVISSTKSPSEIPTSMYTTRMPSMTPTNLPLVGAIIEPSIEPSVQPTTIPNGNPSKFPTQISTNFTPNTTTSTVMTTMVTTTKTTKTPNISIGSVIASAQFTNDFLQIIIIFKQSVSQQHNKTFLNDFFNVCNNFVIFPSISDCEDIFDNKTNMLLSSYATCEWSSSDTDNDNNHNNHHNHHHNNNNNPVLVVSLSGYSILAVSDRLTINPNVFSYSCNSSVSPQLIISDLPSIIGICNDLPLNARLSSNLGMYHYIYCTHKLYIVCLTVLLVCLQGIFACWFHV